MCIFNIVILHVPSNILLQIMKCFDKNNEYMYIYKQLVISALETRFYIPILQLNYFSTKHQQVSGIACRPTSLRSSKARCATTRRSRPCSCRDAWDCTWWPTWRWEGIGRGSRGATKTWTLWWCTYIYIHTYMYLQKYTKLSFNYTMLISICR